MKINYVLSIGYANIPPLVADLGRFCVAAVSMLFRPQAPRSQAQTPQFRGDLASLRVSSCKVPANPRPQALKMRGIAQFAP